MRDNFYEAEAEFKKGRYKKSLQLYQTILKTEPQNAYALQGAAMSLSNLGQFREAYELAERALVYDPNLVLPHVIFAYAYDEFGEKEKGREEAKLALKKDPNSTDVLCCMGVLYLLDNKFEVALEYLERAIRADPLNYLAQHNLAVVYQNIGDTRLFKQSVNLLRLKPNIRNLIKAIYLSTRLHRPLYFSVLVLSGLASIFIGPQVILVVTLLLVLVYMGTGLFMVFTTKGIPKKTVIADSITGISIGVIGALMYLWAIILLQ